ncbi:Neutral ceramidase 3 [Cardamine amara subsp. amara]|uniref:Neutral ceramidase n=1 Tax=Cardamine amara subsp. amara TaxID=228776 RepID=A0ABD0ZEY7_CARAN
MTRWSVSMHYTYTLFLLFLLKIQCVFSYSDYLIGLGSYDITGPAADVNMMGYANMDQVTSGVHFRLRARSFIVAEPNRKRFAFVNLDAGMASQLVTIKVIERLKQRYGELYTEENVAISGTHTHAGPGGYLQYILYLVTSLGFVHQSFNALVDGIEQSIIQAHENLRPGSILINKGELLDAGVNRSPSAYLNNPADERSKYEYDVDKEMTLVKFVDDQWGPVGSFNWFATHGTSMSRTNSLISGDNKGTAARIMEDWFEKKEGRVSYDVESHRRVSSIITDAYDQDLLQMASSLLSTGGETVTRMSSVARRVRSGFRHADKPSFVSAFCQTNCGDVSPNVLGTFCIDTGLPCDFNHSTCGGKNEQCYGRGPGYPDEFESTRLIGERQFKKAADLFNTAYEEIQGKVDYRHAFVDFSKLEVTIDGQDGGSEVVKTCLAAMGFGFAAGTTDGPGAFDFRQGDDHGNTFWRLVRNFLKNPTEEQVRCHRPKPILLDTGEMKQPYNWAPSILPVQILRIGQLVILCVPGEFTTMAGRRLRDAVKTVLKEGSSYGEEFSVVIAGLTNTYSQYIATFEEYQVQRYEGASTLYGPHTLSGYIQEFKKLAHDLLSGQATDPGPQPPDLLDKQISLVTPVVADMTPIGTAFGDVISDVPQSSKFRKGIDIVTVKFRSANPRNDLMTEGTFALVERWLEGRETWVPVYDDDDICLRFKWSRPFKLSTRSSASIEWRIPETASIGVYRITHFGSAKTHLNSTHHFSGSSSALVVY